MLKHLMAGVALALLLCGHAAAELGDYKNIGPMEVVGRIVRDIAGDDVEVRRAASDELKALSEKSLTRLGTDPDAEKFLVLIGDGLAELFWMGKATSRTRAERSMDDVLSGLSSAARSPDMPKANAAHKVMVRYVSVLLRNADHSSSAAALAELKRQLKYWPEEEIKPAEEVVSFLTEAPEEKKPAAAAQPPAEPVAAKAVETADKTKAAPAPAAPAPEPVTVVAPEKSRPAQAGTSASSQDQAPSAKPRLVDSAAWKYADPALKVTTVVAPSQSRAGAAKPVQEAAATATATAPPPGDGTSILNLLQMQLASEDDKKLESGLKLTSKTSEEVLSHLNHGSDERSKSIIKRVRVLLDHKNPAVKRQAMKTAVALKDSLAAPQLAQLVETQDETSSKAAYEALKELSGIDLGPTKEPWVKWASGVR